MEGEREKAMGQRDAARVRERKKDMGPRHEREGKIKTCREKERDAAET